MIVKRKEDGVIFCVNDDFFEVRGEDNKREFELVENYTQEEVTDNGSQENGKEEEVLTDKPKRNTKGTK